MIVLLSVIKTFDNCVILRQIYGLLKKKIKIKIKIKSLFMYFLFYFSGGGTSNSADGIQTRVNSPYTIEQMQRNGSLTNRKMSVQVGAWWMNFFSQNFNGIPVGKTDGFSNWISINVIFLPKSLFANFWGLTVQNITSPFTPARTHSISGLKYRVMKLSFLSLKMMVKSGLEFILK